MGVRLDDDCAYWAILLHVVDDLLVAEDVRRSTEVGALVDRLIGLGVEHEEQIDVVVVHVGHEDVVHLGPELHATQLPGDAHAQPRRLLAAAACALASLPSHLRTTASESESQ